VLWIASQCRAPSSGAIHCAMLRALKHSIMPCSTPWITPVFVLRSLQYSTAWYIVLWTDPPDMLWSILRAKRHFTAPSRTPGAVHCTFILALRQGWAGPGPDPGPGRRENSPHFDFQWSAARRKYCVFSRIFLKISSYFACFVAALMQNFVKSSMVFRTLHFRIILRS